MATDKPSDASGIFSNETVKQSMSAYSGSVKGDRSDGFQHQTQPQLNRDNRSEFSKSPYDVHMETGRSPDAQNS